MALSRIFWLVGAVLVVCARHSGAVSLRQASAAPSFFDPPSRVRPRFRYWVPDASVDLDRVAADIAEIGRVGAGGIELLGYYLYGYFFGGIVPVDWTKYAWGTPAWASLNDAALRATKQCGLVMDYAIGPNQGAGIPSKPNADGLMWTLQPFNVTVSKGGTFDDILPGWGTGKLVSASVGLVVESVPVVLRSNGIPPTNVSGAQDTLKSSSLKDFTSKVSKNGSLYVKFNDTQGLHNVVFAYYLVQSDFREVPPSTAVNSSVPQSPITSFVNNGSWVVDHFSSEGAHAVIEFWEQHLLSAETKELLKDVGNYAWEDSQEYGAGVNIWWTPNLLDTFKLLHNYGLERYLPIMFSADNIGFVGNVPSSILYITDEADQGLSHRQDFWQTLTQLNQKYLYTLSKWARGLSAGFSAQIGYNLPIDMLANIPDVDAPECESFALNNSIDSYKQYTGAANLAGKRIISSEHGATQGSVFSQTLPDLIWGVKRAVIGSVNQFVFHGFPYSGNYPNTTWPVFTTFVYLFSGMHGPHQPAWDFYSTYMDWTARVQYITQSGTAKSDVAIWLKEEYWFNEGSIGLPKFATNDLVNAGYTYDYISPDNFALQAATVTNRILAPNQQAFKALIVPSNASLTVYGVNRLADYAHAGLPIFFAGGTPSQFYGYDPAGKLYALSKIQSLGNLPNVRNVAVDQVASALTAAGIEPRTRISANATWYTHWREAGSTQYVFVYNDAAGSPRNSGSSTGTLTFAATGAPYWFDAWTGQISPLAAYSQSKSSTTMTVQLKGNQSMMIAFLPKPPSKHVAEAPANTIVSSNGITINAEQPGTVKLTNGSTIPVRGGSSPITLNNWTLILESWTPVPSDLYTVATKRTNTTYLLSNLVPWSELGAGNVSGKGYYSTTFSWGGGDGAYLDLGSILHTAQASINGHLLQPLDPTWAKVDIGSYLKKGHNQVEVVVSSTLNNAVNAIWEQLLTSGHGPIAAPPGIQDTGLLAPVSIVPYKTSNIVL